MIDLDAFSYQQEPFEDWFRDGTELFDEHLVHVGEQPGAYATKNLPLLRTLDTLGVMQITTARGHNGRMLGYLMAIICPSFESETKLEAMHTTFFASSDAPGLGLRLQRASIDALRARGVSCVVFRAGTRGSGPRMGALYRRLGAEEFGQLFMLELGET